MTNNYFFNLKIKIKSQDFKRPRIFSHLNRIIAFEWQFDNLLLFFFLQRLFINYFLLIYHYNPDCMTNVKFESLYFHFVGKKIKLHYNFVLIFCKLNNWSKYFQNKKKKTKKNSIVINIDTLCCCGTKKGDMDVYGTHCIYVFNTNNWVMNLYIFVMMVYPISINVCSDVLPINVYSVELETI